MELFELDLRLARSQMKAWLDGDSEIDLSICTCLHPIPTSITCPDTFRFARRISRVGTHVSCNFKMRIILA